jgi:hypothetical protein
MLAFWKDITQRGSAEQGPAASRDFPVPGVTAYTWCRELFETRNDWGVLLEQMQQDDDEQQQQDAGRLLQQDHPTAALRGEEERAGGTRRGGARMADAGAATRVGEVFSCLGSSLPSALPLPALPPQLLLPHPHPHPQAAAAAAADAEAQGLPDYKACFQGF